MARGVGRGTTSIVRQASFFSGQVDPIQFNRTEFANYLTAAQSLQNCIVDTTGIVRKRDGTLVVEALNQSYNRTIGFETSAGTKYVMLVKDRALVIYGWAHDYYQRFENTPYSNPYNIYITYVNGDLIIFNGGKEEDGGTPPQLLRFKGGKFVLEKVTFDPLPSRDFNDVDYGSAKVSIGDKSIIVECASDCGFNDDWIGGAIVGVGENDEPGEGLITGVTVSGNKTTFALDIIHPLKKITKGSQISIRKPMMSSKIGWPSKGLFFLGRLWLWKFPGSEDCGTGSTINKVFAFHYSSREIDAIFFQVPQTEHREVILWIHAGRKLEVYTDRSVYTTLAEGPQIPGKFQLARRTSFGASDKFQPISYQNDTYYVSKTGNSLIKFEHNGFNFDERATNVSKAAETLLRDPIGRVLITGSASSQDNLLMILNSDKSIVCFQFSLEVGLAALTPFEMVGDVLDITVIDNSMVLLKRFEKTDQYTLEVMENTREKYAPPSEYSRLYLDSSAEAYVNNNRQIENLNAYEGYSLRVITYNEAFVPQDYGVHEVVDGVITLDKMPKNTRNVMVGFTYDVEITPMYFWYGTSNSNIPKHVVQVIVEYYQSIDFYIDGKIAKYQYFDDISKKKGLVPHSGYVTKDLLHGYKRYDTFTISQRSPFNLCVTSISYKITGSHL